MEVPDLVLLRRAKDTMDREFERPLNLATLARVAGMSSGHFSRMFKRAYGETPHTYLLTRRIERAKTLLRQGDLSVTEVCLAVGASSLGSFGSRFAEVVGMSPTAYRALDHSAAADIPPCIVMMGTRPARRPPARSVTNGEAPS